MSAIEAIALDVHHGSLDVAEAVMQIEAMMAAPNGGAQERDSATSTSFSDEEAHA